MSDPHMPPGVSEWDIDIPSTEDREADGPEEPEAEAMARSECCYCQNPFGALETAIYVGQGVWAHEPCWKHDAGKWLTTSIAILECEDVTQLHMVIRFAERRIAALRDRR